MLTWYVLTYVGTHVMNLADVRSNVAIAIAYAANSRISRRPENDGFADISSRTANTAYCNERYVTAGVFYLVESLREEIDTAERSSNHCQTAIER